jgi:hypothetical protein
MSNGGAEEKAHWGELLKSDLQREIQGVAQQVQQIHLILPSKLGWSDVVKGIALAIAMLATFAVWVLSQSKDSATSAASAVTLPLKQEVAEARREAKAAQLQAIEGQRDIRALSKQISTKQIPARLEREPRVVKAEPPAADGGP